MILPANLHYQQHIIPLPVTRDTSRDIDGQTGAEPSCPVEEDVGRIISN